MSESAKRVLPYPLFLLACILVIAAFSWCSTARTAAAELELDQFLKGQAMRKAQIQADRFCRTLGGCARPLVLTVEPGMAYRSMRPMLARATRMVEGGCRLIFDPTYIVDGEVVAHEVCHCALDYEALGEFGYVRGTTLEEAQRREARARACAAKLVGRR